MNFNSCEKQMFKSFSCTKIANDLKWTKTSRNEVAQPTTSKSDSRPIFRYYVHIQAGFGNPFINERGFIYLGFLEKSSTLQGSSRWLSVTAARKANIWLHAHDCS